jgi:hypothetical protein
MKTHERAVLELHAFLVFALDGDEKSVLHPGRFTPEQGPFFPIR